MTPRSITLGQMASQLGPGSTEVGVFGGVGYAVQTNPSQVDSTAAVTNQTQGRALSLPGVEANIARGFTDQLGLNVHLSSAGVQPGLKWTLNKSKIANFALLPAIGFGYASYGETTFTAGDDGRQLETNPNSVTSFTFLVGLKAIFSHRSGFYMGVGYDLLLNRSNRSSIIGSGNNQDRSEVVTTTLSHQIMGAIGLDVPLGFVHLRPEIAFAVYPAVSQSISSHIGVNQTDLSIGGGFGWAILPGFTLAVASPIRERTQEEEDEVKKPVRRHDDDDDEDDDNKVRTHRKPKQDEDDEPRKRRGGDDDANEE